MNLLEELRTLDPKQPGNWPWPIKIGAFVLAFLAIQVAAFFLLWKGQNDAIEAGRAPETAGDDNIKSLAMVFGAIESARRGARVPVEI